MQDSSSPEWKLYPMENPSAAQFTWDNKHNIVFPVWMNLTELNRMPAEGTVQQHIIIHDKEIWIMKSKKRV